MTNVHIEPPMTGPSPSPKSAPRALRAVAVATAASVAAAAVWAVARVAGGPVHTPAFKAGQHPAGLPVTAVVVAAVVAACAAWAVVTVIDRRAKNPARTWLIVSSALTLLSLSAPLSGHGVPGWNRLALVLMHLAVAGILIPGYAASRIDGVRGTLSANSRAVPAEGWRTRTQHPLDA